MAFELPDLRTLIGSAQSDIEAELPGKTARLRRSNLNVLARVQAGMAHGMYGFVREFLSQCLPWSKGFLLRQWAEVWSVFARGAESSQGPVVFTGTDGSVIDADTRLQTPDGREYATLTAVTIAAGTASVNVIAVDPGAAGNLDAGVLVSLVNPVAGVNSTATIGDGGLQGGLDAETADSLYGRYQFRVQNPPHGGNQSDYEGWATEVPGVTRAWVFTDLDGESTIQVYFVREDDAAGPIPDVAAVAAVQAYIDEPTRKPLTAQVFVYPPVEKVVNYIVSAVPDTPAVRASIEDELRDFHRRTGDLGGTLFLTQINEAISLADGETDHTLVEPAANVVCAGNEFPVFGTIEWV